LSGPDDRNPSEIHTVGEASPTHPVPPRTEVESWIHRHVKVTPVSSARLRFDRMLHQAPVDLAHQAPADLAHQAPADLAHQAPSDLAGVYRPHDPAQSGDWSSLALIYAFVHALETHGRILDIGSGDGWPALPIAPYLQQVVGIDPSPRRTEIAKENLLRFGYDHVQFRTASGEDLPFRDRSFDGIVAGTAIEQATDRNAVLAEAFRVLRPGGRFVLTFENVVAASGASIPIPDLEEKASLDFDDQGNLIVRYIVLSRPTSLETEYRVVFRGEGLSASLSSGTIPAIRKNGNPEGEPRTIDRTDPNGAPFDVELLERLRSIPSLHSITAERCIIRHFTAGTVVDELTAAGFDNVIVRGRVSRAVAKVADDLAARGVLSELADQFHPICASLAKQWPLIGAEQDPAPFVVAQKPTDRTGSARGVGRGGSQT